MHAYDAAEESLQGEGNGLACTAFGIWKQSVLKSSLVCCLPMQMHACKQSRQKLATLTDESLFTTHALLGVSTS